MCRDGPFQSKVLSVNGGCMAGAPVPKSPPLRQNILLLYNPSAGPSLAAIPPAYFEAEFHQLTTTLKLPSPTPQYTMNYGEKGEGNIMHHPSCSTTPLALHRSAVPLYPCLSPPLYSSPSPVPTPGPSAGGSPGAPSLHLQFASSHS